MRYIAIHLILLLTLKYSRNIGPYSWAIGVETSTIVNCTGPQNLFIKTYRLDFHEVYKLM